MLETLYKNGHSANHHATEQRLQQAYNRIEVLRMTIDHLSHQVSQLNTRLSRQNRIGTTLDKAIENAAILLAEHAQGNPTGYVSIRRKYADIGRKRWEWAVAALRMAGIVRRQVDRGGLLWQSRLMAGEAFELLKRLAVELGGMDKPLDALRQYLPVYRRAQ